MRGVVDDLPSGVPLGEQLPAVLQEDEFALRLMPAFDTCLAPVLTTLDDLDAYVDPHLAPDDFLDWLGTWVGVELGHAWDLPRRREIVAGAVASFRRDGSVRGLLLALQIATDADVQVTDSGGASWSSSPNSPLPGRPDHSVHVKITATAGSDIDARRLDLLVGAIRPAHVTHTVEVVEA